MVNQLVAGSLVLATLIDDDPMPQRGADQLGNEPVEATVPHGNSAVTATR